MRSRIFDALWAISTIASIKSCLCWHYYYSSQNGFVMFGVERNLQHLSRNLKSTCDTLLACMRSDRRILSMPGWSCQRVVLVRAASFIFVHYCRVFSWMFWDWRSYCCECGWWGVGWLLLGCFVWGFISSKVCLWFAWFCWDDSASPMNEWLA